MATYVEVPLPEGGSLIVEQGEEEGGIVRAGRVRDVADMATETFEAAMDRLRTAAEAVNTKMRSLQQPPADITVQFSVKLGTAVGVVIANTSAEANLTVTLRWEPGKEA
ncbi:CU044_2847 family protein [Actinomadura sp. 9N215]|uniref:CU044_2847 family protein n=1 Tax=Actinomadura sp. 9N215 TaxID=3375150 RepID=UPI00379119A8